VEQEQEPDVFVCMPVAELSEPYVPSLRLKCDTCNCEVWASVSMLTPIEEGQLTPRCWNCVKVEGLGEERIRIHDITRQELKRVNLLTEETIEATLRRVRKAWDEGRSMP
jgi:hypothetical protein